MSTTLLFNKPFNVLCQFRDAQGRACLGDFIDVSGVYAAGRLDRDSEGLLVLTDDGAVNHKITDPAHKMSKTYWVQVEGSPSAADLAPLADGVELKDGVCLPAQFYLGEPVWPAGGLWPIAAYSCAAVHSYLLVVADVARGGATARCGACARLWVFRCYG